MTVEISYLQSGTAEVINNSSNANTQDPITVTVAIQDLPPGSDVQIINFFKQLPPDGRFAVTGWLMPYNDYFNIEPGQYLIPGKPYELIRVYHDDLRRYRPNGLPVRAQKHIVARNFQPTPEEDAIIQPL